MPPERPPTSPASLPALLDAALPAHGHRPLLVDLARGSTATYADFADLVEGAAARLAARVPPGGVVALLARNGLAAAVHLWACARAGLVALGLPDLPAARLREVLDLTEPALLLAQPGDRTDLLSAVAAGQPVEDADAVLLGAPSPWRRGGPHPDPAATYCLIATSGSTGRPKAVRVTGAMVGAAVASYASLLDLGPEDCTPVHLPFAWVSGHVTQLAPTMATGGRIVTMERTSAAGIVAVAAAYDATWLDVVPSLWELLLRDPGFGRRRLPRLRAAVFGGAPAPPGTLDRVRERLPGVALHDVYALSETCAPVTVLRDGDAAAHRGSVGRAEPWASLRVVGGELQVAGAAVTPGYAGAGEPSPLTADGWLRTGDAAEVDADGWVTVLGRVSALVIRGGVNVHPAAVERALLATGLVSEAAAVGLPSRIGGQVVAALVVGVPGAPPPSLPALRQAVAEAVGAVAVPRPLRVVPTLPRNANGKADLAAVSALLQAR